jgi:hypothetical protein
MGRGGNRSAVVPQRAHRVCHDPGPVAVGVIGLRWHYFTDTILFRACDGHVGSGGTTRPFGMKGLFMPNGRVASRLPEELGLVGVHTPIPRKPSNV